LANLEGEFGGGSAFGLDGANEGWVQRKGRGAHLGRRVQSERNGALVAFCEIGGEGEVGSQFGAPRRAEGKREAKLTETATREQSSR